MRRLTRPVAALAYGGSALLVLGGTLAAAQDARAVPTIDDGVPGVLVLEADPAIMSDAELDPGEAVYWPIATQLEAADSGDLEVAIEHAGELASARGGLRLAVERCAEPWEPATIPVCAAGATTVVDRALSDLTSGSRFELGTIRQRSGPYFLATVSLPDAVPATLQGTTAEIAFGFFAVGDAASVAVPLGGSLPNTGIGIAGPLVLGVGLVWGGLVFARQRLGREVGRGIRAKDAS